MSISQLAHRWGCSERHVRRMADSGRCPRPIRLGSLIRWPATEIEQWERDFCPSCKRGRK
ncbi:helix-turn-helix transcriptional regulator [Aureliella helgolandensis]|uniref:helix-turn-helix transcriptional regulator n=1 Tax=Aureliella helgolandensis TaxID=2527968 RepID=UPI0037041B2D